MIENYVTAIQRDGRTSSQRNQVLSNAKNAKNFALYKYFFKIHFYCSIHIQMFFSSFYKLNDLVDCYVDMNSSHGLIF